MPCAALAVLWRTARPGALDKARPAEKVRLKARYHRRYGQLYQMYDPGCWWWEMVEIARKLLLIAMLGYFRAGSAEQLWTGVLNPNHNPSSTLILALALALTLTPTRCAHLAYLHPAADLLQALPRPEGGRGVVGSAGCDAAHAPGRRRAHGLAGANPSHHPLPSYSLSLSPTLTLTPAPALTLSLIMASDLQGPECDCTNFLGIVSVALPIVNMLPLVAIVYLIASTVTDLYASQTLTLTPTPTQTQSPNPKPKPKPCPGTPPSGRASRLPRPECCRTRGLAAALPTGAGAPTSNPYPYPDPDPYPNSNPNCKP